MNIITKALTIFVISGIVIGFNDERENQSDREKPELDYQSLLDKQVAGMIPLVEQLTELKYREPLKVEICSNDEYREYLKKEFPKARDHHRLYALVLSICLTEEKKVVVHPELFASWLKEKHEKKEIHRRDMAPTSIHEITHAIQDQYYELPSKMKVEKDF